MRLTKQFFLLSAYDGAQDWGVDALIPFKITLSSIKKTFA